ncbi:GNAT family N-acetyltransferase [candidate division KSB1 bacterium]|nr:GNAT family N-acetyltransferase [candidate division KSB1 bacterium]
MDIEIGDLRLARLDKKDFREIYAAFGREDFYYSTKRPASLSSGEIIAMLQNPKRRFYTVRDDENRLRALCDYRIDEFSYRNVNVNFRIIEDADWSVIGVEVVKQIFNWLFLVENFIKATMYVFQFDSKMRQLCDAYGFKEEGLLNQNVFKYGRFYNTLIYSKLQQDYCANDLTVPLKNFKLPQIKQLLQDRMIRLRRVEDGDLNSLYKWESSDNTYRNVTDYAFGMSTDEFIDYNRKRIHGLKANFIQFIVETRHGKPIGTIGLYNIDWKNRNAELVVIIGEEKHRGLGYGMKATMMLQRYAFVELNLHSLYSRNYSCNEAIMKMNERAPNRKIGRLRNGVYRDGKYYDVVFHSTFSPFDKAPTENQS